MDWTNRLRRGESWKLIGRRKHLYKMRTTSYHDVKLFFSCLLDVPVDSRFAPPWPEKQAYIVDRLTLRVTPSVCLDTWDIV